MDYDAVEVRTTEMAPSGDPTSALLTGTTYGTWGLTRGAVLHVSVILVTESECPPSSGGGGNTCF